MRRCPSPVPGGNPGQAPHAGFTLIELLVVVAIISILAAMLLPALARARAKAQQILCLGNFKQLHTGLVLYSDDSDSLLPTPYSCAGETNPGIDFWYMVYCPYIIGTPIANPHMRYTVGLACKIFDCPTTSEPVGFFANAAPFWGGTQPKTYDYGTNSQGERNARLERTYPSAWVLTEAQANVPWYTGLSYPCGGLGDQGREGPNNFIQAASGAYGVGSHHLNGVNFVWPDGNAGHRRLSDYAPFWPGAPLLSRLE